MTERPILFSGPMPRAILDGRKTQTRRVVKPQPGCGEPYAGCAYAREYLPRKHHGRFGAYFGMQFVPCPYGSPVDRLWVRETWAPIPTEVPGPSNVAYRADGDDGWLWSPSIYMPRWASRITLEVVDVRVEQVQYISEEDATAEGAPLGECTDDPPCHVQGFIDLWDSINAKRGFGWAINPWVWVIEFRRIET